MKGRDDERTSVTPGPKNYEHETKKSPAQIRDEKTREARRAAAKQRFLGALCRQKLRQVILRTCFVTCAVTGSFARISNRKTAAFVSVNHLMEICFPAKNFPAFNHYDPPKSVFDKDKRVSCKCGAYTIESYQTSFNQIVRRFEEDYKSDTPGPGAYEIAAPQICYGSILRAPFGAFDVRFKKIDDTVTPGPADYHTNFGNLAFESAKRFKDKHKKIIDYSNFYQILASVSDDDKYTLADECKVVDERKCPVYHAVFKSRVDRFPRIRKHDDVPDPGAYEALSAFNANRDRCDFLCRRLAPPFGSRASRFPAISKGVDFHVPGPFAYDLRGDISKNVKYGVICYALREKKEDIKGPGPSHYHIHPYYTSSLLKKSFNVTLGKSKIIEDIKMIQNPWHQRQPKKILRWFAAPCKRY